MAPSIFTWTPPDGGKGAPRSGLPPGTAALLRENGWDAVHVREIGMRNAADEEILSRALAEGRFCVTLDKDFHEVLAETGAASRSVVLLRVQGLRARSCADLLREVWARHTSELEAGFAVTEFLYSDAVTSLRPRAVHSAPASTISDVIIESTTIATA